MAATPGATSSQVPQIETAILWFRRDLRVTDNRALVALQGAKQIVSSWAHHSNGAGSAGSCMNTQLRWSEGTLAKRVMLAGHWPCSARLRAAASQPFQHPWVTGRTLLRTYWREGLCRHVGHISRVLDRPAFTINYCCCRSLCSYGRRRRRASSSPAGAPAGGCMRAWGH